MAIDRYFQQTTGEATGLQTETATRASADSFGYQVGTGLLQVSQGLGNASQAVSNHVEKQNQLWYMDATSQAERYMAEKLPQYMVEGQLTGNWDGVREKWERDWSGYGDTLLRNAPPAVSEKMQNFLFDKSTIAIGGMAEYQAAQGALLTSQNIQGAINNSLGVVDVNGDYQTAISNINQVIDTAQGIVTDSTLSTVKATALTQAEERALAFHKVSNPQLALDKLTSGEIGSNLLPEVRERMIGDLSLELGLQNEYSFISSKKIIDDAINAVRSGDVNATSKVQSAESVIAQRAGKGVVSGIKNLEAFRQEVRDAGSLAKIRDRFMVMDALQKEQVLLDIRNQYGESSRQFQLALYEYKETDKLTNPARDTFDPVGYLQGSTVIVNRMNKADLAWEQAGRTKLPQDIANAKATQQEATTALLSMQQNLGIPKSMANVMSKGEATAYQTQVMQSPEKAQQVYLGLVERYGVEHKDAVLRQVFGDSRGLPAEYALIQFAPDNKQVWEAITWGKSKDKIIPERYTATKIQALLKGNKEYELAKKALAGNSENAGLETQRFTGALINMIQYKGALESPKTGDTPLPIADLIKQSLASTISSKYTIIERDGYAFSVPKTIASTPDEAKDFYGKVRDSLRKDYISNPTKFLMPKDADMKEFGLALSRAYWVQDGEYIEARIDIDGREGVPVYLDGGYPYRMKMTDVINGRSNEAMQIDMDMQDIEEPQVDVMPEPASNPQSAEIKYAPYGKSITDVNKLEQHLSGHLSGYGHAFVEAGLQYGIDPALLVAIAKLETGHGKSDTIRDKHNAMGITGSAMSPKNMAGKGGIERSIFIAAESIATKGLKDGKEYAGYEMFRKTKRIEDLAQSYAPPEAENDPRGTNPQWPSNVKSIYRKILNS